MAKWTANPAKLNILVQYGWDDNNMKEKHISVKINFSKLTYDENEISSACAKYDWKSRFLVIS